MKKNLTLILCLSLVFIKAQTLTQTFNEAKTGDVNMYYNMDTTAFTTGMPISVTGSTSVWNFTKLQAYLPLITDNFISPASVTNSANYPGCTVVQDQGGISTFMKSVTSPTAQTEVLGVSASSMALTFTNSAIIIKYPFSFGNTYSDNLAGSFTASLTGNCSGKVVTTADGLGTLNLPNNLSLSNVLRVKSVQTISLSITLLGQIGTIVQTVYNYYHANQKFPILSINYNYTNIPLAGAPTLSGLVSGISSSFVAVGIQENQVEISNFNLFPNPAKDQLTISMSNTKNETAVIQLYSLLGNLIKEKTSSNSSTVQEKMDLSGLPAGVYLLKTSLGTASISKKIIID